MGYKSRIWWRYQACFLHYDPRSRILLLLLDFKKNVSLHLKNGIHFNVSVQLDLNILREKNM